MQEQQLADARLMASAGVALAANTSATASAATKRFYLRVAFMIVSVRLLLTPTSCRELEQIHVSNRMVVQTCALVKDIHATAIQASVEIAVPLGATCIRIRQQVASHCNHIMPAAALKALLDGRGPDARSRGWVVSRNIVFDLVEIRLGQRREKDG